MEKDYYQQFKSLTENQLIKAIHDYEGYTEEAKPHLKMAAVERGIINEDMTFRSDDLNEEQQELKQKLDEKKEKLDEKTALETLPGIVSTNIRFYNYLIDQVILIIIIL